MPTPGRASPQRPVGPLEACFLIIEGLLGVSWAGTASAPDNKGLSGVYLTISGYPANNQLLGTSFQKAYELFGAKPARVSAFIGVPILMDTEALAGFAMPARASAFNSV